VRLTEVARVQIPANAYSLYIRQRGDAHTQVFSLDYGEKLRVYDTAGAQKSARPWSSKVRCIAVGDVKGDGDDALVGGVGKRVLIVDQKGKPIWKIPLESSVIACDARDVDGDDAAEVVAALQNRRVILWNHDQTALFSRTVDQAISDVWLEDITNDSELEVVIAERKGNVTILTAAGYELKRLKLGNAITVFAVLTYGERKLFVTGDHTSTLRIWDIDGNELSMMSLSNQPKAMASGQPDDVADIAYLVVSTRDRKLGFWEIQEPAKHTKSEKVTLQKIESTKQILYRRAIKCGNCGAPTSPEAAECSSCGAKLEVLDEYAIEEYIQDAIDSITTKHQRIKLKELDSILRKTLPQPAAYNLRRSIQTMIKKGKLEGHFDKNTFVRTVKKKPKYMKKPTREDVKRAEDVLEDLMAGKDTLDVRIAEKKTGIDRRILRHTLMILLGEGLISGNFYGDIFTLDEKQNRKQFLKKLSKELQN
jgi:WD40 repeat protein